MPIILAVRKVAGQGGDAIAPLRIERGEAVIGRGTGAHLMLQSPAVSRRHCVISGEIQTWRLVDSSSGGTFVNGQRISGPHFLQNGDVIRVGDIDIAVMVDAGQGAGVAQGHSAQQAPAARGGWGQAGPAGANATQLPGQGGAGQMAARPMAGGDPVAQLLQSAGLSRAQVGASDQQVLAVAGSVLRAALAGLVRLAQDRNQAREDLGIAPGPKGQGAGLAECASPEELLLRLLSSPGDAAQQVAALSGEIDAHQRAVLAAMQDSFHHALDQFSPRSIKSNARSDADAWKAFESAFEAEDGFVETFARAFARAYGKAASAQGKTV